MEYNEPGTLGCSGVWLTCVGGFDGVYASEGCLGLDNDQNQRKKEKRVILNTLSSSSPVN